MSTEKTTRKAASSLATPARTVVYCHGIGNKSEESALRSDWDHALFGYDQGERTRMAYWVDRARYPKPEPHSLGMRGQALDASVPARDSEHVLKTSIATSDNPKASQLAMNELAKSLKTSKFIAGAKAKGISLADLWKPITEAFTNLFMATLSCAKPVSRG